ncbi:MAG: hypothetical protein K2I73_07640, partial [Eubacterium sp.]|nr:hypothetical protein [Eubacterium sp.]
MSNKLYTLYANLMKPQSFASWAKPKAEDLNIPRKRNLNEANEVVWNIGEEKESCADHIEMAGFYASAIISYGKDKNGRLKLMKHLVVPTLRTQPNVTQSSFCYNFNSPPIAVKINQKKAIEYPKEISIKGNLKINSSTDSDVCIIREFLPAVHQPALIEIINVCNNGSSDCTVEISSKPFSKKLNAYFCVDGAITAKCVSSFGDVFNASLKENCRVTLKSKDRIKLYAVYYAYQKKDLADFSIVKEIEERRNFVDEMFTSLRLETPINELNAQFAHCVLRGSESIFKTKNGLMHAPGGGNYYAALWTNDQCEYANPFFPFSGYAAGIEQSINCYSLYESYMDKSDKPMQDKRALVTSIISEGIDFWNGAGDRGDGEMYAYGISRFLLEMSDEKLIHRFWDNLVWCLDFALSRKTKGIIASDSDELENRFPSGNANLFTSCITYDALGNAAILADVVGDDIHKLQWLKEQAELKENIEKYFGRSVEGFETYRYYDGNENLRSWICMPLTVEIFDRAEDTVRALFSSKLYYDGMMRSSSDHNTTWDRSLLFALRGTFLAGMAEKGIEETVNYCKNRLLGSHAPYPYEAYPEGNRAHLAAESLLFARVVTEGLLGLRAVGMQKLRIKPQLTKECPEILLSGIKLFSKSFNVKANENGISVEYDNNTYHTKNLSAVFDFNT